MHELYDIEIISEPHIFNLIIQCPSCDNNNLFKDKEFVDAYYLAKCGTCNNYIEFTLNLNININNIISNEEI